MHDQISRWLRTHEPGSSLIRVWPLGGGVSSTMTAFTIKAAGSTRSLVVRQPNDWTLSNIPNAVRSEYLRLGALHAGGLPVQAPVFLDEEGSHFSRPSLLIEYIDGAPDLQPADPADYLLQCAHQLAAIHRFDPTTPGLCLQGQVPRLFGDTTDEVPEEPDPVFQVERIMTRLYEHAATEIRNAPVLLHGDFWPGNMLWRDDRLVGVIDWEEPGMGDPLADLAISRLDMFWILGLEAMQTFTRHYLDANSVDTTLLPLWDLRTAPRPVNNVVEWATAYPPLGRSDINAETMRTTHTAFVEQAFRALA